MQQALVQTVQNQAPRHKLWRPPLGNHMVCFWDQDLHTSFFFNSIKGLLPDALLVQLPKKLLFAMLHVCMGHPILTRKNMGTSLFKASCCRWFQVVVSPSYLASWSQIRIFFTPGAAKTTKQKPILVPGGGQFKHLLVAQLPSSETSWCV